MSKTESKFVECPICSKSFLQFVINSHVEECLLKIEASDDCSPGSVNAKDCDENKSQNQVSNCMKRGFTSPNLAPAKKQSLAGNRQTTPPLKKLKKSLSETPRRILPEVNEDLNTNGVELGKSSSSNEMLNSQSSKLYFSSSSSAKPKQNPGSWDMPKNKTEVKKRYDFMPLAERMRPLVLDDFVGQNQVLGSNSLLRSLLEADKIPSMVFWGPPGCGKTTLAHVIANKVKKGTKNRFVKLSAVTSGINDIKEVIKAAKNEQGLFKRQTILFVDEIHRFNKLQQDAFLPHVEDGTIILIGATTENPSFQVNSALLSRCRVIILEKHSAEDVEKILLRAVETLGASVISTNHQVKSTSDILIEENAIKLLANLCDGDARVALNALQLSVQSVTSNHNNSSSCDTSEIQNNTLKHPNIVKTEHIKESLQKNHLLYDRNGDEHYNLASALQKSIRGSDPNAAIYWMARMLLGGEDPLFIARRLVVTASEDIGLADPSALPLAVAAFQACQFIGMPECRINLSHAVAYLARAPKSCESYQALNRATQCIKEHEGPLPGVPLHLRNAPTALMKNLGYGKGYTRTHEPMTQEFLPTELAGMNFFETNS